MKENPDQDFLAILHRHQPVSVQELCAHMGVTTTAVRQRLLRLQSEGLLSRQVARQDRGRPHYTYAVTSEGLKYLGDDQGEMAALLWREIMRIEQPEVKNRLLAGVKSALVQRFGPTASTGSLPDRLRDMCQRLSVFGFDVDYVSEPENSAAVFPTLPVLREHNCPYHEIASEDPSFCEFEQSVFSELLGASVELSACRLEGHRCCEFQVGSVPVGNGQF